MPSVINSDLLLFCGVYPTLYVCLLYNQGDSSCLSRWLMTNTRPSSQISMKNYNCTKDRLHNTGVLFISKKAAVETKYFESSWSCKKILLLLLRQMVLTAVASRKLIFSSDCVLKLCLKYSHLFFNTVFEDWCYTLFAYLFNHLNQT